MNTTNDFISLLINNREKIVDKLLQNSSYNDLINLFDQMNVDDYDQFNLEPNDKFIYRLLTGSYQNSRYNKSSIDWIPSKELVDGLFSIANHFKIIHIEEVYAGLGILSGLMKKRNTNITITTSDPFENNNTCNQLGIVPIAHRSPYDFKYYKQLGESYPQMIISSYYPFDGLSNNFLQEISELIQSKNHSIIAFILPNSFTEMYNIFYHIELDNEYKLFTYHVKAIDKYYYIHNLMKDKYKSAVMIHLFIKKELLAPSDNVGSILSDAIIPTEIIDKHCRHSKIFKQFYEKLPQKLVKSLYKYSDFKKPITSNIKIKEAIESIIVFKKLKINVPHYIYHVDEFIFWSNCIIKNLYFVFQDRLQFYTFYTESQCLKNEETRKKFNFPGWINTPNTMHIYLYFDTISPKGNWKTSRNIFRRFWEEHLKKNKNSLISNA